MKLTMSHPGAPYSRPSTITSFYISLAILFLTFAAAVVVARSYDASRGTDDFLSQVLDIFGVTTMLLFLFAGLVYHHRRAQERAREKFLETYKERYLPEKGTEAFRLLEKRTLEKLGLLAASANEAILNSKTRNKADSIENDFRAIALDASRVEMDVSPYYRDHLPRIILDPNPNPEPNHPPTSKTA